MRTLIVDDNPMDRMLLVNALEQLGHDPVVAEDGAAAWQILEAANGEIDVVVSDWRMPGLEGPDLCRRVRKSLGGYTYFILMSLLEDQRHVVAGMQAGADDYLTKPLNIDQLGACLIAAGRVVTLHRRREALLRASRSFAMSSEPKDVLRLLLAEAVALLGADSAVVYRWLEESDELTAVASLPPSDPSASRSTAEHRGVDRAIRTHSPAMTDAIDLRVGAPAGPGESRAQTALAVPLLCEGRLLGALSLGFRQPRRIPTDDVQLLEVLAGMAAAAVTGVERAQMVVMTLAARELAHLLNNDLAIVVSAVELIKEGPIRVAGIEAELSAAADGLAAASAHILDFQRVTRIATKSTPVGEALDLTYSIPRSQSPGQGRPAPDRDHSGRQARA